MPRSLSTAVAHLILVRPMKTSKLEIALSLGSSFFMLIAVFYQPLRLPEFMQWAAFALTAGCLIPLFIVQKRRRDRRLRGELLPETPSSPASRFWLILMILVAGTLSGPLWLPFTGTSLPLPLLIVTSIISCIVAVGVFLLAWRYWRPKT